MAEASIKLLASIWGNFSWSLIALGALLIAAVASRADPGNSAESVPHRVSRIIWVWPVYIWGLQSVVGLMLLLNWHNVEYGIALQPVQQLIFSSLYCLTILVAGIWIALRVLEGRAGPKRMHGALGWSFHMSILSVLAVQVGVFVAAFRLPW